MVLETAAVSLIGDRAENQDRVTVLEADGATLLLAIDGMGGHANGARAAELAADTIASLFRAEPHPVFDIEGFLHLAIGRAHAELVALGADISVETRPRATCAACLIQDGAAWWAHVGDSRIYHLREQTLVEHSRDHSHIEVLLYDGAITRAELASHPMRNYVECCLGGDTGLPRMSLSRRKPVQPGDIMLVCSDGLWSPIDAEMLAGLPAAGGELADKLQHLAAAATRAAAPHSDNTSVAAARF